MENGTKIFYVFERRFFSFRCGILSICKIGMGIAIFFLSTSVSSHRGDFQRFCLFSFKANLVLIWISLLFSHVDLRLHVTFRPVSALSISYELNNINIVKVMKVILLQICLINISVQVLHAVFSLFIGFTRCGCSHCICVCLWCWAH